MRYLTKTLFKLASEKGKGCPTKLYYINKLNYHNHSSEDSFLNALKEGGFQVGALAKQYIEGGVDLEDLKKEEALLKTKELLEQDNVIIYEALFRRDNLEIRCDILIKKGNNIEIIEVKSKSVSKEKDSIYDKKHNKTLYFLDNKGKICSKWRDYILDIAFQSYVINKDLCHFNINCYLMLTDKDAPCPTDGLNQKFIINRNSSGGKNKITSLPLTDDDKSIWVLKKINVDEHIKIIQSELYSIDDLEMSFETYIHELSRKYVSDNKIVTNIGSKCKKCEFCLPLDMVSDTNRSGFYECWRDQLGWDVNDFEQKTVLSLWNSKTKDKFFEAKKVLITDLSEDDFNLKKNDRSLETSNRQWLQVQKYQNDDDSIFIHPNLREEISSWKYPLHFIDFETCTVAIPFHHGHFPYDTLSFQFSHHIYYEDGRIEHKGQFIETKPNYFPNFDFIKELKNQLDIDKGSIFRFHNHENTVLNRIRDQLYQYGSGLANKEELIDFIEHITVKKDKNQKVLRKGDRCMIDLEEILRKYTFFPNTDGRTSMKVIFPAILQLSEYLQEKYSKPIYGSNIMPSFNFRNWQIVEKMGEAVIDPYKRLPGITDNIPIEDLELFYKAERISDLEEIKEGGMAATAYALMQYTIMPNIERLAISNSLLKYCELDTLAMVILYEFLKNEAL